MVSVFSQHPKFITTTLPTRKVTPAQINPTAHNHPNACSSFAISTDEDTKIICERLEKGRVFVVIRKGWKCCECDRYGINVRHRFPRPIPSTYPLGHGVKATTNRGSYVQTYNCPEKWEWVATKIQHRCMFARCTHVFCQDCAVISQDAESGGIQVPKAQWKWKGIAEAKKEGYASLSKQ